MTEEFERAVDKIIREARERGEFDDLPGKGRPINWEDESMTPEDQRLANRLLKHNNFTLDWIALGQELDQDWEGLQKEIERLRANRDARDITPAQWRMRARELREKIQALNKRVIGYNLRAPEGPPQRRPYPIDPDIKEV